MGGRRHRRAVALPMVLWNAQHEWVSFAKQFGRVGAGQSSRCLSRRARRRLRRARQPHHRCPRSDRPRARGARSMADQGSIQRSACSKHPAAARIFSRACAARPGAAQLGGAALCFARGLRSPSACPIESARTDAGFGWLGKGAVALGFAMSALLYLHAVMPLVQSPNPRTQARKSAAGARWQRTWSGCALLSGACWIATSSYATTGQLAYELEDKAPVVQLTERVRYMHICRRSMQQPCSNVPHSTWSSSGAARRPCWRNASVASLSSRLLCAATAERSWPATRCIGSQIPFPTGSSRSTPAPGDAGAPRPRHRTVMQGPKLRSHPAGNMLALG